MDINTIKVLDAIYQICQNTPNYDRDKDHTDEVERLENAIDEINQMCIDFFSPDDDGRDSPNTIGGSVL